MLIITKINTKEEITIPSTITAVDISDSSRYILFFGGGLKMGFTAQCFATCFCPFTEHYVMPLPTFKSSFFRGTRKFIVSTSHNRLEHPPCWTLFDSFFVLVHVPEMASSRTHCHASMHPQVRSADVEPLGRRGEGKSITL